MEYRVFWEIDVDAENEVEAAKEALKSSTGSRLYS